MANVLQHPVDFHLRPLSHAPSPLGFGFGLGASTPSTTNTGWQLPTIVGHTNPAAFHQLASMNLSSSLRAQKRRHDGDDDSDRDRSMDRSPTPERPKRAAPKRARVALSSDSSRLPETHSTAGCLEEHSDVDIGMLLASLPSHSLLSLLSALLSTQPSLKPLILSLIPRPSLETALQAMTRSAKKLREAVPYSHTPSFSFSQPAASTSFVSVKPPLSQSESSLGNSHYGMRNSYIINRLRPHIEDFTSTYFSYLPYFSLAQTHERDSTSLPSPLQKEKPHPAETFLFLLAATKHVVSQLPIIHNSFGQLLQRLWGEWKAWVQKVDETVNRDGGMFGRETVQSWERGLDEMAASKLEVEEGGNMMEQVRNLWVAKVGWMVGRTVQMG